MEKFKKLPKFIRVLLITVVAVVFMFIIGTGVYFGLEYARASEIDALTIFGASTLTITAIIANIIDTEAFEEDNEEN